MFLIVREYFRVTAIWITKATIRQTFGHYDITFGFCTKKTWVLGGRIID